MLELQWDIALSTVSLLVFIWAFLLLNSQVRAMRETNDRIQKSLDEILKKIDMK